MGHLAQSTYVRASWVEVVVPGMIERAIIATLAPIRAEFREHQELITAHGLALDDLTVRVEACKKELQASFEIPLATMTENVVMLDKDAESDALETDEEELGARDAIVYDDLEDLEGVMVQAAVEASLQDTSIVGSSRVKNREESSTNAQIEGVIDM
ncbi:hypothetical protein R3W88_007979 [Solanum pinnatisectum]|uniref:Polyprotein protein n=1 Tax=Solanum pinnatisectum TaxID=50273 RepID=A0AAV9M6J2_9SOLN|nr:hypothetical protein R3W88_007979 [Solanum pinnatisectum]